MPIKNAQVIYFVAIMINTFQAVVIICNYCYVLNK